MKNINYVTWHKHKDLEKIAADIHSKFKCKVPVDIDYIVEMMGLEIFDIPRLKQDFRLLGLLARVKGKYVIYVPQGDLKLTNYSLNFTIAEELSHYILHKDHFEDVDDFVEAYEFYTKISEQSEMMVELDAKHLASAILLPKDSLRSSAEEIFHKNKAIYSKILDNNYDAIIDHIASSLEDKFKVPEGKIAQRLKCSELNFREFLKKELGKKNKVEK